MGAAVFRINSYIDDRIDEIPRVAARRPRPRPAPRTNFLIIGSDTRSFVQSEADKEAFTDADTTADGPPRSDTMMVLHADGDASYVVSFPRDLMVERARVSARQKINAAFNKGPQLVIDTLAAGLQRADQPLPRGELQVVRGHRERGGHGAGLDPAADARPALGPRPFQYGPGCYQPRRRNLARLRRAPATSSTTRTASGWTPSGRSDIDRIERQQDFIKRLGRLAVLKATDDPSIAPDLADHLIPQLTADQSFDRAVVQRAGAGVHGPLRGRRQRSDLRDPPVEDG